jgi:hypothetical protein
MELTGKIHQIGETEVVGSAGTFKKRTIIIATDERYVQKIPIDFVQDKCIILDKYAVGQEVKVSINVRGNEYNGKFYVSLNGWRIEAIGSTAPTLQPVAKEPIAPLGDDDDNDDPLPF